MHGYQMKLDFGEGPECQQEYETFLELNQLEDSEENWVTFCDCWKYVMQMRAMAEKQGQSIQ